MVSVASGELKCNSRVNLFPLPFFTEECIVCNSPLGSARVRRRLKVIRAIHSVTNRTIFTLNRLYNSDAVAPLASPPVVAAVDRSSHASAFKHRSATVRLRIHIPPSTSAFQNGCPPIQSSLGSRPLAPNASPLASSVSSDASSPLLPRLHFRLPPIASRSQSRLLLHLRSRCAAFVWKARLTATQPCSDDDIHSSAMDIFQSYQFEQNSTDSKSSPDLCAQDNSTPVAVPFSVRSDRIEGPLPTAAVLQDSLPLISSFSSAATAVVPLIAHRVSLPSSLRIVPLLNVLPPEMAARYAHEIPASQPNSLLRPAEDVLALNLTAPLKPARIAGSRSEYVKLVDRMLQQGMLSFTATPRAVNGVFAVGKDASSDRLIIDAQPANRLFVDSPHVSLPDPSHLVQLRVPKGACMKVGKSDMADYYHHEGLPSWMQPYFALPALTSDELTALGLPLDASYPMCATLPMGFSHAVLLAQSSHEYVVYSSGALRREDNLLCLDSPDVTSDRVVHGIVIDDFFLFSLNQELATAVFHRVLAAYRAAGFVVKPSKVIEPTDRPVKVIGFMFEHSMEGHTTVSLASDACLDLARVTLAVLVRGQVSGLGLAHLIGRWTWCMLLRRSSLAVLQHSYRYIEVANRRKFSLWPSVRQELWMLLGLLPLLHARLDVPTFKHAVATDASEWGAGVVCSTVTPEMDRRIWHLCSSRAHATMQTMVNAAQQRGGTIDSAASPALHAASQHYSSFYADVAAARWSTIVSSAWRSPEHINALELRAVLLSLHWLLSYPSGHSSRVYLLVDSTVALFALWKGRSSSARLLVILRKISALLLASGTSLLTGWLPSAVNPADRPSRRNHPSSDE